MLSLSRPSAALLVSCVTVSVTVYLHCFLSTLCQPARHHHIIHHSLSHHHSLHSSCFFINVITITFFHDYLRGYSSILHCPHYPCHYTTLSLTKITLHPSFCSSITIHLCPVTREPKVSLTIHSYLTITHVPIYLFKLTITTVITIISSITIKASPSFFLH